MVKITIQQNVSNNYKEGGFMGKIVTKDEFKNIIRPNLKLEGKVIALCHGVFDLIHPGHIIHFEQSKAMADVLVVSITNAVHVRKGPGRPFFDDEMRMRQLCAIEYIDYVMLSEEYTVDDIVEAVEPDLYIKGSEYRNEDGDITKNIRPERELVERHGGKVAYTDGQVFSSTKLINTGLSGLSSDVITYMQDFKTRYRMDDILNASEKVDGLKVLVIGDIIIDEYTYCDVMGLMSKDIAFSVRENNTEKYYGGSVAIARHLSSFTDSVTLMGIIGNEDDIRLKLYDSLSDKIQLKLINSNKNPTIIKHRYLIKNERREEYRKVFSVNNIPRDTRYEDSVYEDLKAKIEEKIDTYDAVFLCDFGHGMIKNEIMNLIQERARYLILNCQTNSTNNGLNPITKYHKTNAFTVDQKELKLAMPILAENEQEALKTLSKHLGGNGWLTRGSAGAYGIENGKVTSCPALTLTVKDTVGAGDAFYSIAGLYSAAGISNEMSLFLGNIAGALGANIVGNKESIEKINLLKFANTLMNV